MTARAMMVILTPYFLTLNTEACTVKPTGYRGGP